MSWRKEKSFSMGANKLSYSGLYMNWLLALSSESPWLSILWLRFPFSCWLLKHLLKTNAIFPSSFFFPTVFAQFKQKQVGQFLCSSHSSSLKIWLQSHQYFTSPTFDLDHSLRVSVVNHWKYCWSVIKRRSSLTAGKLILSVSCSILEGRWFP